jgi:hypothetical protein
MRSYVARRCALIRTASARVDAPTTAQRKYDPHISGIIVIIITVTKHNSRSSGGFATAANRGPKCGRNQPTNQPTKSRHIIEQFVLFTRAPAVDHGALHADRICRFSASHCGCCHRLFAACRGMRLTSSVAPHSG